MDEIDILNITGSNSNVEWGLYLTTDGKFLDSIRFKKGTDIEDLRDRIRSGESFGDLWTKLADMNHNYSGDLGEMDLPLWLRAPNLLEPLVFVRRLEFLYGEDKNFMDGRIHRWLLQPERLEGEIYVSPRRVVTKDRLGEFLDEVEKGEGPMKSFFDGKSFGDPLYNLSAGPNHSAIEAMIAKPLRGNLDSEKYHVVLHRTCFLSVPPLGAAILPVDDNVVVLNEDQFIPRD